MYATGPINYGPPQIPSKYRTVLESYRFFTRTTIYQISVFSSRLWPI